MFGNRALLSTEYVVGMFKRFLIESLLPLILIVTFVGFAVTAPKFRSPENIINLLKQSSYLIMLATGQMILLVTRGFDLSVGTVISMISVASALAMVAVLKGDPNAIALAILMGWLVGLAIGLAVGSINGFAVAVLRVNPFVTTLGMMGIGLGFASTLSGGRPVYEVPEAIMDVFSRGSWIGIPVPVAVCAIVLGSVYLLMNRTVFGRSIYILGSNERAAYVAGLSTRLHLGFAYVICSLIVAIVAIMLTARTGSGEPRLGISLMLDSLMAAIIGGVSLSGGEGRILHCILGGLFVTILSNGMNMIRVNGYIQMMILGAVLIAAIFVDGLRRQIR